LAPFLLLAVLAFGCAAPAGAPAAPAATAALDLDEVSLEISALM
jgi:hypothetical protein